MIKRFFSKTIKHSGNNKEPTCRVLVANDSGKERREMASLLAQQGADVTLARNGRECVNQILAGHRFDLVLMDVRMPVMDGYSAATLLRSNGFTGKIVSMSTKGLAAEQCDSMLSGCDAHVRKREVASVLP